MVKYCATRNITQAENRGECVEAAFTRKLEDMKRNGTKVNMTAFHIRQRCERIDYGLVEKGPESLKSAATQCAINFWLFWGC